MADKREEQPITDVNALPAVLTIDEAASLLRISVKTAKDWCRAGQMPGSVKVGREWRVMRDDLLMALDEGRPIGPAADDDGDAD